MCERKSMWRVLVVLVMAMMVVWLGACAAAPESSETMMVEETFDGEAALQDGCTKCHDLGRVTNKQYDRERWEQVVDGMIQKGAEVADKEALVDYLAETYGP